MKENSPQQCGSPSPGSRSPGTPPDSRSAEDGGENEDMEVKQVTLHKRSGVVKQHGKKEGVLTAELVSSSVSHLGRSGSGLQHLYYHLSLPSQSLWDVSVLCNYVHIQRLELPHNQIKDLSCVTHLPYLVILDASHNEISDFFGFQPPKNLKEVNFSHNCLTEMKDLSAYTSLRKLDLDNNGFTEISGLEKCCKLTHLSLAHNRISKIAGLDTLPLQDLCLRGNQLVSIDGLENQKNIRALDLSLNRITGLSGLQNLHLMGSLNMEQNLVSEISECKHIHDLFLLRELDLMGNLLQERPDYRLSVLFLLQHLRVLDQEKVTAEEKVASMNKYDPPMDVVAAKDHMTHMVFEMMQPQVLFDSTLPSADSPYPMLVLTGPQGCGKRELAHRLCQEFNEYFAYGTSHTTRGPYFGEENGSDYFFVSEEDFENLIHMGKFIQTLQYGGHRYGLTRDAIEDAAREGLACCVHMELEGVLSLKSSYFEPRYILLIPTDTEKYVDHLTSRGIYTPPQIKMAVSRIEIYASFNRQRPGFFDNVIPCDDWEESYRMLAQVVKDYLLLDEQEDEDEDGRGSPDKPFTASGQGPEEKPPAEPSGSASVTLLQFAPALDPSDPAYRNYSSKIREQLGSQRNPTELASCRRREQLVREAIVGRSPGVFSQLIKSSSQTEPSPEQNPATQYNEDSSPDDSCASSVLSVPSSAGALSGLVEPLDSAVLGNSMETIKDQQATASHAGLDQLTAVTTPSSERRPGSDAKPILPPIPTGRKTPAALSPSPCPSPKPAATEQQETKKEEQC